MGWPNCGLLPEHFRNESRHNQFCSLINLWNGESCKCSYVLVLYSVVTQFSLFCYLCCCLVIFVLLNVLCITYLLSGQNMHSTIYEVYISLLRCLIDENKWLRRCVVGSILYCFCDDNVSDVNTSNKCSAKTWRYITSRQIHNNLYPYYSLNGLIHAIIVSQDSTLNCRLLLYVFFQFLIK